MTTEQAVKIGDIIIDEETGEILEMPEGIGDPLEWLTHRANEAKLASKAWAAIDGMYRSAIGNLLVKAGVKKLQTKYGIPMWTGRLDRRGKPERLREVAKRYELTGDQQRAILGCANELNAKRLDALEGVPTAAKRDLIDENESSWVQIKPLTPQPPDIERVKRP